jgi:prephenate dehydrogenase
MLNQITIIGMGLLGGSIGMGCVQKRLAKKVVAVVRRESALDEVKGKNAADEVTLDIAAGVREADLIIFSVPIPTIPVICETIAKDVPEGCIVTDVASVKCCIVQQMEHILGKSCRLVGSHPMAGAEKSGIHTADPSILKDSVCIVTPTEKTDPDALATVKEFWGALGMRTKEVSPGEHDQAVALISHLPHVAAYALMNTIQNSSKSPGDVIDFAGPGFRDATRIAASSPVMWTEICMANKSTLLKIIKEFRDNISYCIDALENENSDQLRRIFTDAQALKEKSLEQEL